MAARESFIIDEPAEPEAADLPPRRRSRTRRTHIAINLTSLIDVTFLLLIYFMVATDFRIREQVYRLDLPERASDGAAVQADPFSLDHEPLRIVVASTDLGPRHYVLRVEGPYQQPTTFEELLAFLRNRQINETTTGGLFEPDHPIIIAPAATARWEHAVEAFNMAARARYTNIVFAPPVS